jgi:hypothetical protein
MTARRLATISATASATSRDLAAVPAAVSATSDGRSPRQALDKLARHPGESRDPVLRHFAERAGFQPALQ